MREVSKKLSAVGMIESEQEIKGQVNIDRRYFIVSAGVTTAEQFALSALRTDTLYSALCDL